MNDLRGYLMNRCRPTRKVSACVPCLRPLAASLAALLLATALNAQDAPPQTAPPKKPANPDSASNLDAVVVTGIQASIQNSLKAKENSDNIIEAISAEDIGKLPDSSIAESLARLSGLATQRVDGRANQISIRGLAPDFAGTTLNGREQATIGENRGVDFDQYPSELISGAAVYKTPDASLIGQGLSGTVDLHTIRPLDLAKPAIAANLRGETTSNGSLNHGSGVGDAGHRASFSYIDQFFDHTLAWRWASPSSIRPCRRSSTRPGGGAWTTDRRASRDSRMVRPARRACRTTCSPRRACSCAPSRKTSCVTAS